MKMKNIYLLILVLGVLVSSCELPDNKNPKAATDVPAETVLTNALRDALNLIDNMSQNVNVSRFLCQYSSQMQYTDPSRYQFSDRQIPDGYWNTSYLVLQDLREVKLLIQDLSGSESFNRMNANRMAIVDIVEVMVYHNLVDFFGDVPYTEALGGFDGKTPAYDDAATIYEDLQARLTADISTLAAGASDGSWGVEDLVFAGDVDMWKKAAATIKLRLGMRLADVNPSAAQSYLSEALAAGLLEPGESMQLPWVGVTPHVNTIYNMFIVANRNDYAPSATIIDMMVDLDDARLPAFFTQVDTSTEVGVEKLAYRGLDYGLVSNESYPSYSHYSDEMFAPDFPATFACNAEVEFMLAEAAARGFTGTPGTAQEHYEAGIAESHDFWGVTMPGSYLNHPDVSWDAARDKELIGTQKWLALYNRGNEGYCVWRTFDWPVLVPPEDMTYSDIPFRMPFPYNEPDLNGDNYDAAASAIGGDDVRTRLFWDVADGTATPAASF
ncbi:MAG: SusD/RagB family nutrient-binding outer membrane lipoprotein [Bacteroidales bacterium]|nr:SusD/RagB family nutrient-binding outer membrane lipoprotein [Bacteroidales bacterium]